VFDVSSEEIRDGNLPRALVVLATPLAAQGLVRVAEGVVDLFWLGRLSGTAVSGVGLANAFYAILVGLVLFGPPIGTQILVSQRVGDEDTAGAQRTAFNGLVAALGVGVVGGLLAFLFIDPVIGFLAEFQTTAGGLNAETAAIQYLEILFPVIAVVVLSDTLEFVFLAHGDSKTTLLMNIVPVTVNLTLDPLLIFGVGPVPALGVQGAALASVGGWVAGLLFGLAMVATARGDGLFSRREAVVDVTTLRAIADTGVPVAAQQTARQVARFVMVVIVFIAGGGAGVAAYYLGSRVAGISFVPAGGLKDALQSVVGQNIGAGNADRADRATRIGFVIAVGVLTVAGAAQLLVPGAIVDLLGPTFDAETRRLSARYLRLLAYSYPAIGAAYMIEGGFNGLGRTRVGFVSTVFQFYLARLPIAIGGVYLLGMDATAVFWAVTLSNVAAAGWLGAYYLYSVSDGAFDRAVAATE